MRQKNTRRLAYLGVLTAAALCLSWLESLLPLALPVPGAKLGLANIAVMIALFTLGAGWALTVMVLKCVLTSFLFGNFSSLLFSLFGGILSLGAMWLCRKFTGRVLSQRGGSRAGAALPTPRQKIAAPQRAGSAAIFSYLPLLLLASVPLGILTAFACYPVIRVLWQNRQRLGLKQSAFFH